MSKRIFISVANSEHAALRNQLRDTLTRAGFDIVVQPDFPHSADDTVRKQAGRLDILPTALLTAALHHHAIAGDPEAAARCLDEAEQIAGRGPMPLTLADVHLHRARLFRDRDELKKARALIETHGYGRRKEELADAEEAAANW